MNNPLERINVEPRGAALAAELLVLASVQDNSTTFLAQALPRLAVVGGWTQAALAAMAGCACRTVASVGGPKRAGPTNGGYNG